MKTKPVILIVDDQPTNIELLEAYLAPQGYEIVTAANGKEALEKLSGNQIDLILLDVMMPGIDGFEVTRRVRQDNKLRLLPIILVTALKETEDRIKGIEAGCDDFISKPVDKMELLARVRSLLKVKAYNDLLSNYQKELESEVIERTEELKGAFERYLNLYDFAPVGYFTLSEAGLILEANLTAATLLGVARSTLVKQPLTSFILPVDQDIYDRHRRLLFETGAPQVYEISMMRAHTIPFWVRIDATAVQDADGASIYRATMSDITERKTTQSELQKKNLELVETYKELREKQAMIIQQEKMASIGILAAGVAHEIKNPLTIMLQGIDYLQSTAMDNPLMIEVVEKLNKAVLRAEVIVNGLLSYARQNPLFLDKRDILTIIDESLALTEYEFRKKNVRLIRQSVPDLPMVSIDGNQIKQVFVNMLINGIDAMSQGGTFTISTRKIADNESKNFLEITFKDTGQGIPTDKINKIFDPFYTTKAVGNTGLGLSISRGIIDKHGGIIHAESKIGQGTIMIIKLPIPL